MALIDCPECQRKISQKAQSCPQCGYPLSSRSSADFEFPFRKPMNELAERITNAINEFMKPPSGSRPSEDKETETEDHDQEEKTTPSQDDPKKENP